MSLPAPHDAPPTPDRRPEHESQHDRLHDPRRLGALSRSGLLAGTPDPAYDRLSALAAAVLRVPVALVSIVDERRQVFVGCVGLPAPWDETRETPLSHSFCQHVIGTGEPLVIEDAREHPLVRDNLAIRDLGVIAYAGMPLTSADGQVLGSFCAIDTVPRRWTAHELEILRQLAGSAVTEIALRTAQRAAEDGAARLEAAMQAAALGAWSYDPATGVRWHSARASELLGEARTESLMPREAWLARVHPDDRAQASARLDAAAGGGDRYDAEYRVPSGPDAPPRWLASTGRAIRGTDGAVERVVGTLEDVTDRIRREAERQESTERLRTFVEAVPLFAWINAADGTVESFNRRWYAHTGQDETYARDGRWLEAVHPEDRGRVREARAEGIARGAPYAVDFRVRGADGGYRWTAARVEPVRGPDGAPTSWVGAALDIDDRRRLEAERERLLAETEATRRRLSAILESISSAFLALDAAWTITYANAAAEAYYGRRREDMVGRVVWDAFPLTAASEHRVRLTDAMARRESVEYEIHSPTFGRWLRVRADAAADGGLSVFVDDIDERRRAEAWRDGQRRVLEQIASSRPPDEVLASVAALAESQLQGGTVSVRLPDGDAARHPLGHWSRPIASAGGRVLGALVVEGRDPDAAPSPAEERVVAEAADLARIALERARLEGEREAALAAERAARAEAEGANRAKSDFLAVMSHELRTPLNAIGGYAELIEMGVRGPVSAEQRADLARLQKSQRHLLGLINGVLNYAKIDAGAVDYRIADVPLDEVLATCEALVAPQVRARALTLHIARAAAGLAVRADREKLQQVLLNLLSNAVKFTEPGGRITLACTTGSDGGGTVRLSVTDTGRGIAADMLGRVFEPFVQVDTSLTRTGEGTGLGLAISRDLARGMGGELAAESEAGVGSTFTLTLPVA